MDLLMPENSIEGEESCDSSSEANKADYAEACNYDSEAKSASESQADFADVGMRNSVSSGLTMKEYEEQLKKLTAENFNLKLKVYFVEERLSKVTGISDKEDLIKKNIQLKVTCESQLKELEKKQELLFEASKAFELLQKEHAEEVDRLIRNKDKEITELEEKLSRMETLNNEIKLRFPNLEKLNDVETEVKTFEEYEKQIQDLELNLRDEEDRYKELEHLMKDNQLELETYKLKCQRMESEIKQRTHRIEELVDELEQKEHDLASANFRIRKLEDEMKSKQREDEIMKERIEEKNKTIESLKNSLTSRHNTIEALENRIAKERSTSQTLQSKLEGFSFQNTRLKEELEILQSRLRRSAEVLSPRGKVRSVDEDLNKQKYEELLRAMEDLEAHYKKQVKELQEKLTEKEVDAEDYNELSEKHKKLEDDHRRACIALKNFIKRSSEEKKERETLNHILNNHEEVIADLKAQLDEYRNNSSSRLPQDNKLSLAETGDNNRKCECTVVRKDSCCVEKNNDIEDNLSTRKSEKEFNEKLGKREIDLEEKMDRVSELEAEVIVLSHQLENESFDEMDSSKEIIVKELEMKECEIEKLNNELKRRNINLQEIVNKELWDKNRQIEKLENRLTEMGEKNKTQMLALQFEINEKDCQLEMLQNKMQELGIGQESLIFLECKLSEDVAESEDLNKKSGAENNERKIWRLNKKEEKNLMPNEVPISESTDLNNLRQRIVKSEEEKDDAEIVRKEAAKICSMLMMRLEELSAFLDALLKNGDLFAGDLKKRQEIKEALEKSRELSRQLSQSFNQKKLNDTSLLWNSLETTCSFGLSMGLGDFIAENDSMGIMMNRDKVISDQTVIINRLREQLKLLNQEIKQRDIELSHCQGDGKKTFDLNILDFSDQDGIEKQTLSICQDLSDYENENNDKLKDWMSDENLQLPNYEIPHLERCTKFLPFGCAEKNSSKKFQSLETSESEAWSEPDRSVSLARMGGLEDVTLNISQRNSKGDDSSDSSEETINENEKISVKRGKNAESEIRRLQSKVKALDECNNYLRLEISLMKNGNVDSDSSSKLLKNEESNLAQKLKKTVERLDECNLTCKSLEKKLADALEHVSVSTAQLTEAKNKISLLELELRELNEKIKVKNAECEEKNKKIAELESKIEEITIESELKIIEAVKHKEAAEKKSLEIECRLKDAENISKEVECRVNEIEKQISETKKFKKETALHCKEAEQHVGTAEKMMEEAEKVKLAAERKTKDFQNFIDLMRKEVEEKMKEAERRVRKSEKEKEDLKKQVSKLKNRLLEAEKNKAEVEIKVKEGKETIQCMEEKLKELEVAMDQCNEEAQIKIREIQKKAESRVKELEMKIEEREWVRKTEVEKKIAEADKISKELEMGFKRQLEDAEKKIKKAKEAADLAVKKIQEDSKKQETELRQKIAEVEAEKKKECAELKKMLDEVRLEASEFELELTRLTNEKIHLEEELKRMLDKESALMKDNKELKGKYETSIHELEDKLTRLTLNKSQLASRLEEIESTNIDLVTRISAIRGKETVTETHEFFSATSPTCSSPPFGSPLSAIFGDVDLGMPFELNGNKAYANQNSGNGNPTEPMGIFSNQNYVPPRRNMNSSPDLGIESDPGRFSSLEANQQSNTNYLGNLESGECDEIKKLEFENAELRRRLLRTRQALEETLTQLSTANQRKKQVERAICKQLHKTHHILKKARVNFESQDADPSE